MLARKGRPLAYGAAFLPVTKVEAPVHFAAQQGAQEDWVLPQVATVQVCDGLEGVDAAPCPLLAKAPASESPARSSSTKRVLPYPWYLRARRTSSSVASAGVRKPFSEIACRGVGVLAGLHKIVQAEVACDKRGGLAVRLIQGRRLILL